MTQDSPRPKKKQRLAPSSPKRTTRHAAATAREKKKQLVRRISNTERERMRDRLPRSNPDQDRQEAPTFYQPLPSGSRQRESHPDRPQPSGTPSDEEEAEEATQEAMLARLSKLPEDEYHKVIGKIFALKVWPWPCSSWWIISSKGATARGSRADQISDLDAQKKDSFRTFLMIDMGMSTEEWIRPKFRQEVSTVFFSHCNIVNADGHPAVSERGTSTPI